jgi:hypothetical protein
MIVDDVRRTVTDGRSELSARVRGDDLDEVRIWFSVAEEFAPVGAPDATPFLPPALHWCMRRGESLTIDGPVSPRVLERLDEIQGVMTSLFPGKVRPVEVEAQAQEPPPGADITGCCFSRGVDSWHTILSALDERGNGAAPPTHLVFSPGHVAKSFSAAQLQQKIDAVRSVAGELGLGFVEIDTNVKRTIKGPILVSTVLGLGARRCLIPSGVMQAVLRAKMTHPTLDYRFSTEQAEIVHYGSAGRQAKMESIAASPLALRWIDVCKDDHPATDLNCGNCEKCLRTMIGLRVLGALDDCPAFARDLDPARLLTLRHIGEPHSWVELLHSLGASEFDRRLATGIRLNLLRHEMGVMRQQAHDLDTDAKSVPAYRRASRAVARSIRALDSAERSVLALQEKLLIEHGDHR